MLAGASPGDASATAHQERVQSLWNAGIRTFVSLMEETEVNNAGKPFVPCGDTVAALSAKSGEQASCVRFAIVDVSVPSRETMTAALDLIDRVLAEGRCVYVHCFGGIGRTGTLVGCWLLRHGLASVEDVEAVVARSVAGTNSGRRGGRRRRTSNCSSGRVGRTAADRSLPRVARGAFPWTQRKRAHPEEPRSTLRRDAGAHGMITSLSVTVGMGVPS